MLYWKALRRRVAELQIEFDVQHPLSMGVLDVERRVAVANVEASANKLFGTRLRQRFGEASTAGRAV